MSQKKPAKGIMKKNSVLTLAEKVEQEFRKLPAKLAQLYRQELMTLKLQATKLKVELKKAQVTQKTAQKKQLILAKIKTAASKKQLIMAKKAYDNATKMIKDLTKKQDQLNKNSTLLFAKHIKYSMLSKQLPLLEKQLVKKNKPAKAHKKVTKKTNVSPKQIEITQVTPELVSVPSPIETVE